MTDTCTLTLEILAYPPHYWSFNDVSDLQGCVFEESEFSLDTWVIQDCPLQVRDSTRGYLQSKQVPFVMMNTFNWDIDPEIMYYLPEFEHPCWYAPMDAYAQQVLIPSHRVSSWTDKSSEWVDVAIGKFHAKAAATMRLQLALDQKKSRVRLDMAAEEADGTAT